MNRPIIEQGALTKEEAIQRGIQDFNRTKLYDLELWISYHLRQMHMRFLVENNIIDVTDLDQALLVYHAFKSLDDQVFEMIELEKTA